MKATLMMMDICCLLLVGGTLTRFRFNPLRKGSFQGVQRFGKRFVRGKPQGPLLRPQMPKCQSGWPRPVRRENAKSVGHSTPPPTRSVPRPRHRRRCRLNCLALCASAWQAPKFPLLNKRRWPAVPPWRYETATKSQPDGSRELCPAFIAFPHPLALHMVWEQAPLLLPLLISVFAKFPSGLARFHSQRLKMEMPKH
jgi:hypothetical protein